METTDNRREEFLGAIAGNNSAPTDPRTKEEKFLADIAGYAGGRSTDDASTKKIYWHGLDIYKAGVSSIYAHILNNSSSAINTIDKLIAWFESIGISQSVTVDLSCSGIVTVDGVSYTVHVLRRVTTGFYHMYGKKLYPAPGETGIDTISIGNKTALKNVFTDVGDAVNAVN